MVQLDVLVKHQRGSRGRAWSKTDFIAHIAYNEHTLCKNGRPDAVEGGISPRGWRRISGCSLQDVTCKSCLVILQSQAVESGSEEDGWACMEHLRDVRRRQIACIFEIARCSSIWRAHFYLARGCTFLLTEGEIETYQRYCLFSPAQCVRLVELLKDQGFSIPLEPLGLREMDVYVYADSPGSCALIPFRALPR